MELPETIGPITSEQHLHRVLDALIHHHNHELVATRKAYVEVFEDRGTVLLSLSNNVIYTTLVANALMPYNTFRAKFIHKKVSFAAIQRI